MAKSGYVVNTGAAVVLSAATAKTVLAVRGNAAFGVDLRGFTVAFDGVTNTAVPVLVELCYTTFATNAPGTNSTSVTPVQVYGRALTHGFTAGRTWTTEPTVLTAVDEFLLTPYGGLLVVPLEPGLDAAFSEGYALRCNAPAGVNVRASMKFERC